MPDEQLDVAIAALHARPEGPPLIALLAPLVDWWSDRHLELMADAGFGDVRRAHNAVFVHLPSGGRRITDLADAADMSKQAMSELVDDLLDKGYVAKVPDPTDGRAKLVVWDDRGEAAHEATMAAFAQLDAEVADLLGDHATAALRSHLTRLLASVLPGTLDGPPPGG